ncbi:unnamed protein product [Camellia sinensis]
MLNMDARTMVISEQLLTDFCDELHLSVSEKIGIGLALADSENVDIRTSGQNFCMGQIEELWRNSAVIDSFVQIQNIIMFLISSEGLSKHVDSFMQLLSLMEPKERTPLILAPLLSDDFYDARNMELFYGCRENEFDAILAEMVSETSMADIMSKLGNGCTVDASRCNEGGVIFYHSPSWLPKLQNVHVLVDSIKQLAPNINWINVVENLDHKDPFPLHAICRSVWKNVDGQLSFLRYAVSASPEIFTFSYSARKLVPHRLANHAWLSLDLLEVLCQLAERGQAKYVRQILALPLKQCPELLLLGIAQINTPYNLLPWEVFSTVFPIIVGDAAGSGIMLQLWQSNTKLVLRGFIDTMKTDQGNIVTVLEICQELKAYCSVGVANRGFYSLCWSRFHFIFRLVALATQKEYIDLEKWLNDNIRTRKDVFFEACLNFVKEILFPPEDISANSFQHSGALANLNVRISPRFLKALKDNNVQITSEKLFEELKWLCKASKYVGLRLQNVENSETLTPNGYSNDIEVDANTYLDQLFDGWLSIDDVVQILARFKESSERRKQLIFECMVKNLLEEYQFFPRYPEMQLKIAAILVGSLIKHQLLSNLTLVIAIHTVLETLCKPPDTKNICLWNPELIAFIEHTLARISSSHLISNGGSSAFTDPHSGSIPTTLEMVENATGMLRQHSSTTGFGSALNIETLLAAAERRDTSIGGWENGNYPTLEHESNHTLNSSQQESHTYAPCHGEGYKGGNGVPVVQHSVTIAIQTTKELVLKDYAMESDETCIYNAAHLMVASLAGSLAHVTCKEPLRVSISSQLRKGFNITNEAQEEAVAIVLNDILDLGCAVIEHAATDNALKTIDNEITIQLSLRRKHREGVGPSYYDASMYTQGPMGLIPEALRPRPGHLSHSQQRVYEDFIQFFWQNQSSQSSNEVPTDVMVSSSDYVGTGVSRACVSPTRQLNPALYSSGLRSMGLSSVAQPVYLISEELDPGSTQLIGGSSTRMGATDGVVSHGAKSNNIASLSSAATAPEQHFLETSNAVKKFLFGLTCISIVWCKELEGAVPPLTAASTTEHMASGISEPLFTTGDALEKYQIVAQKLEMLITEDTGDRNSGLIAQIPEIILKCISRDEAALAVGQKVFKSLYEKASSSSHVIYSNGERKFNRDIIVVLIHKDLLNLTEYSLHMAKLIDAGRNKSATEFAISLLQTLLIQESSVNLNFPIWLMCWQRVATRPGASDSLQQLVETARNPAANAAVLSGFSRGKDDKAKPSREKKGSDNATILTREEYINVDSGVSTLFAEWYKIYKLHGTNEATCTRFLSQLQQTGYFNGDDVSDHFFRHFRELSVTFCLSTEGIIILSVTVRVIQKDAEEKRASFNPRPYFRGNCFCKCFPFIATSKSSCFQTSAGLELSDLFMGFLNSPLTVI